MLRIIQNLKKSYQKIINSIISFEESINTTKLIFRLSRISTIGKYKQGLL